MVKNFEDMFIRFDMIHERDTQTDRQTDGWTDTACRHIPRLCIALRGKEISVLKIEIFSYPTALDTPLKKPVRILP